MAPCTLLIREPSMRSPRLREYNLLDQSFRTRNTSEAGVATDHVWASGQAHLQRPLFASITLLTLGEPGMVLSILLVNPKICFICGRQTEWTKMLFPPISLEPVPGRPKFPTTLIGKSHFQCCLQPMADELKKKKSLLPFLSPHVSIAQGVPTTGQEPHSSICTNTWSELYPFCVRQEKCWIKHSFINRPKNVMPMIHLVN